MNCPHGSITTKFRSKSKGFKELVHSQAGFTLVEVMIATILMSLMVTSIYQIVDNSFQSKETIQREDRSYMQLQNALYRMEQDFTQIYSPVYYSGFEIKQKDKNSSGDFDQAYDSTGSSASDSEDILLSKAFPKATSRKLLTPILDKPEKSTLIFYSAANRRRIEGVKQSQYAWVKYSLEDPPEGRLAKALVRQVVAENLYQEEIDWTKERAHTLLYGVKSLEFFFWEPKKQKWVEKLNELSEIDQFAPRAIKMKISWRGKADEENPNDYESIDLVKVFRPLYPYFDVMKDETNRHAKGEDSKSDQKGTDQDEEGGDL
jgi:prepilin-type N-terminal cleavage/methylation domain-containing protein